MGYASDKAAPRRTPGALPPEGATAAPAPVKKSNQMLGVGQSTKFHDYSTASSFNVGNQVRVTKQGKGLGTAGKPSALATASWDSKKPAVENPSGSRTKTSGTYDGK